MKKRKQSWEAYRIAAERGESPETIMTTKKPFDKGGRREANG